MVKKLTSEGFCSVAHRQAYHAEQELLAVARLVENQNRFGGASKPAKKPLHANRSVAAPGSASDPASCGYLAERIIARPARANVWHAPFQPLMSIAIMEPNGVNSLAEPDTIVSLASVQAAPIPVFEPQPTSDVEGALAQLSAAQAVHNETVEAKAPLAVLEVEPEVTFSSALSLVNLSRPVRPTAAVSAELSELAFAASPVEQLPTRAVIAQAALVTGLLDAPYSSQTVEAFLREAEPSLQPELARAPEVWVPVRIPAVRRLEASGPKRFAFPRTVESSGAQVAAPDLDSSAHLAMEFRFDASAASAMLTPVVRPHLRCKLQAPSTAPSECGFTMHGAPVAAAVAPLGISLGATSSASEVAFAAHAAPSIFSTHYEPSFAPTFSTSVVLTFASDRSAALSRSLTQRSVVALPWMPTAGAQFLPSQVKAPATRPTTPRLVPRPAFRRPRPSHREIAAALPRPYFPVVAFLLPDLGAQPIGYDDLAPIAQSAAPAKLFALSWLDAARPKPRPSGFQLCFPATVPKGRIAAVRRVAELAPVSLAGKSKQLPIPLRTFPGSQDAPTPRPPMPQGAKKVMLPAGPGGILTPKTQESPFGALAQLTGGNLNLSWAALGRKWSEAPNDLRLIALAVPLVIGLIWFSTTPKAKDIEQGRLGSVAPSATGLLDNVVPKDMFVGLKENIQRRAAVELGDDFRQGLGDWSGKPDWARGWSYDHAGFIRPRQLALYSPSLNLEDYRFEFLGQIERKALSWVFRAADLKNYYAARLEITRGGPLPTVELVRWAVVQGRAGPKKSIPLPMQVYADTLFRVRVDVRGSDFITSVQGQIVDVFTDDRISRGGVGIHSEPGEDARIRWIEVSHQYDFLGRLCAYLVPYNVSNPNVRTTP